MRALHNNEKKYLTFIVGMSNNLISDFKWEYINKYFTTFHKVFTKLIIDLGKTEENYKKKKT